MSAVESGREAGPISVRGRVGAPHFSAAGLLGALLLLFIVTPFVEQLPRGDRIEAVLVTLVFLFAVLAVGGRHRTLIVALILMLPTVIAKWINHFRPDVVPTAIYLAAALLFGSFVVVQLLLFVMRTRHVDTDVLCAAICGYLLMGLVWAFAYMLVTDLQPGAISFDGSGAPHARLGGFTAFYFSLGTQTTSGTGTVIPISNVARMLAVMQATAGSLYLTVLIARLVSLYSGPRSRADHGV